MERLDIICAALLYDAPKATLVSWEVLYKKELEQSKSY